MRPKFALVELRAAWLGTLAAAWLAAASPARADAILLAAASTTDAVTEIAAAFAAKQMGKVVPVFGASSALAKQIENGAPAALFLSADEKWMDYLDERKLLAPGSRSDLLGNSLVLIAPKDSAVRTGIAPGMPLARLLGDGRLAVGDPSAVPAGIYAQAALEKLGLWDQVKDRLAVSESVRAALALVERGETPLGIVYATDAAISAKVRVVATFPADSHPPIRYPVARIAGHDDAEARALLDYVKGPESMAIFARYGFGAP